MTTTTSTGSSSSAPLVVNGLISGIDTASVISALLQGYEQPVTDLDDQQQMLQNQATDYGAINSDLQALLTSAQSLSTKSSWNLAAGTSSDASIASVNAAPGAQTGTASFNVDQLAQGNVLVSEGGVSSIGATVTSATSLLVATGANGIGFSGFTNDGLALGAHTIDVTQSSTAGSVTGSALAAKPTITAGSNDNLDFSIDGTGYSLTIPPAAAGTTYTPSSLVAAINAAATTAGVGVTASLSNAGALELSSTQQGSAASLTVTGGDALSTLGLTAGQTGQGTDAVVAVDGTSTTLSSINPGQVLTLNGPSGAVTATVAAAAGITGSLLTAGSAAAQVVSTGNGSLSDVAAAINSSGLAVTASTVEDAQGSFLLQVSANATGLDGSASIDSSAFTSGALSSIAQISASQDALVSVGGTGGYQLSSSTDVFSNILAGSSVTVASTGAATVTVSPDSTGEAAQVQTLVNNANQVLSDIQSYAGYNAVTKTGGNLMGSAVLDNIQQQVLSLFASAGGTSGLGNALSAGISLTSSGTLKFDSTKFTTAYAANPAKVAAIFTQGSTFAASNATYAGDATLVYAGDSTEAGSYDVQVSQSATQATATGSTLSGGAVGAAETLSIAESGTTASYTTTEGESLTSIAAGLNEQFSSLSVAMSASVVDNGTQIQLASTAYGSDASFTVSTTNNGAGTTGLGGSTEGGTTYAGQDVEGTINGVAATGTGQILKAPLADPTLAGLSIQVSASGITSTTDLGSFSYTPGLAQQLQTLASTAADPSTGTITTTIKGLTAQAQGLNSQISNYQQLAAKQQSLLQKEFATMETSLGSLKSESDELASAISHLSS